MGIINEISKPEYYRLLQYLNQKLSETEALISYPSGPSNDCINAVRKQNIANIVLDWLLDELDVPLGGIRQCYAKALEEIFRIIKRSCSDADLKKIVDNYLAGSDYEGCSRSVMLLVAKLAQKLRPA